MGASKLGWRSKPSKVNRWAGNKLLPGFKEAYKDFVDAEWLSIATPSEVGGMGLPQVVKVGTDEMFYAANMALGLCPMLTSSAAKAILAHADSSIRNKYLPKMVCGEWTGAMCSN